MIAALLQDKKAVRRTIELREELYGPGVKSSLGARAYGQAISSPAFREIGRELRRIDTTTTRGKIEAIFDGRCPLSIRVLRDRKLPFKHPTLTQLDDLRDYILY